MKGRVGATEQDMRAVQTCHRTERRHALQRGLIIRSSRTNRDGMYGDSNGSHAICSFG